MDELAAEIDDCYQAEPEHHDGEIAVPGRDESRQPYCYERCGDQGGHGCRRADYLNKLAYCLGRAAQGPNLTPQPLVGHAASVRQHQPLHVNWLQAEPHRELSRAAGLPIVTARTPDGRAYSPRAQHRKPTPM